MSEEISQQQQSKENKNQKNAKGTPSQKRKPEIPENLNSDGSGMPRKRFYRQRAHVNVLSDHFLEYPTTPDTMDWSIHYPNYFKSATQNREKPVEVVDLGCGFGGLLFAIAPLFPETLLLGMEIRAQVTDYVADKIKSQRKQYIEGKAHDGNQPPQHDFQNVSVIRANGMKFLPNFFQKGQLSRMFILFPDPHFKQRKHKSRIVTSTLLAEYAYVLKETDGLLYTITDVKELFEWMAEHLEKFPLFKRLKDDELSERDARVLELGKEETEEGKKVSRNNGQKFWAVWQRIADPNESTL